MEQMTQANEQQLEQKKITKKELSKAFWIYQLGCELSNSYERLQSLVFCASMIPAIKKLYADDEEQQREALKRHLNFFNTEGTVGASIQGIAIAMEEEKSNGAAISDTAITSIKTGLMGPLAGTLGRNSILSLLKDGKIKQVIYSANVLGMMMMGALSASYVKIASPMTFKVTGGATIVLQDILDQIMKGLLPLAAVMAIYFFMVKKGPRYGIIIGTIVLVSLVTSFFGLL